MLAFGLVPDLSKGRSWIPVCFVLAAIILSQTLSACNPEGTVRVVVGEKSILGRPIALTDRELILLRRDGRIVEVTKSELTSADEVSTVFTPYTSLTIQSHLQGLFGKRYEVSRTPHYVVVHPRGLRQQWADPFEALYSRFTQYFVARGYTLAEPEFPMIVVVLESTTEFNRVAVNDGMTDPNLYSGYYSPTSNWIVTKVDKNVDAGSSTLIHEALHQFAFNRGIHQRWSATPKWCAEGIATMFEAPGVNNSGRHTSAKQRRHEYYLKYLKTRVDQGNSADLLESIVAGDELFEQDLELSYALSWGLAWYLAETRHSQFNAYLQKIAQRPVLQSYSPADRIADFRESFGTDFVMLENHFLNYVAEAQ